MAPESEAISQARVCSQALAHGFPVSVVTPTLARPEEVEALLQNLAQQSLLPSEVVIVDGADCSDPRTEAVVHRMAPHLPFPCVYVRSGGGTALQRNAGIDRARSAFIAFIDDDIRLEADFLLRMSEAFHEDIGGVVGGIAGYITNQYLDASRSPRWRWYRRMRLFSTYEPGRFDYQTGYPINRYMQPPHETLKPIDFMGAGCAVWRAKVFAGGLRFSPFFRDYGMVEDAHLALRAGRSWQLRENGRARCVHLHCPKGRPNYRMLARKTAVNYRYLFLDIVPDRSLRKEFRFWRVQFFDVFRLAASLVRKRRSQDLWALIGKLEGIGMAFMLRPVQ